MVDSDFYALLSPRQVSWKSRKLRVVFGKNIIFQGKKQRRCRDVGELRESDLKGYIYIYVIVMYTIIYIFYYYVSFLWLINMYLLLYHLRYIIVYCIQPHSINQYQIVCLNMFAMSEFFEQRLPVELLGWSFKCISFAGFWNNNNNSNNNNKNKNKKHNNNHNHSSKQKKTTQRNHKMDNICFFPIIFVWHSVWFLLLQDGRGLGRRAEYL